MKNPLASQDRAQNIKKPKQIPMIRLVLRMWASAPFGVVLGRGSAPAPRQRDFIPLESRFRLLHRRWGGIVFEHQKGTGRLPGPFCCFGVLFLLLISVPD